MGYTVGNWQPTLVKGSIWADASSPTTMRFFCAVHSELFTTTERLSMDPDGSVPELPPQPIDSPAAKASAK
jgi:hypothetical protein